MAKRQLRLNTRENCRRSLARVAREMYSGAVDTQTGRATTFAINSLLIEFRRLEEAERENAITRASFVAFSNLLLEALSAHPEAKAELLWHARQIEQHGTVQRRPGAPGTPLAIVNGTNGKAAP